jgi:peptide/nickel transport system permease protein
MRWLRRLARTSLLILLVAIGTLGLVRFAPGYFADAREMDAQYAGSARTELAARKASEQSATIMARSIARQWLHGNLGFSRQYQVPVTELLAPRIPVTARLVGSALAFGWLSAFVAALPLSGRRVRRGEAWIAAGSAVWLAVPIGALATVLLLSDTGGPALAVGLLLGARDFKFLYRLLRRQWREPHLLFARTHGIPLREIVISHLLRPILPQLAAVATMSFVAALSMAVPAEVLFDIPGVGQLAWTAAMNRDLPVLLAVTLLMAAAVGCAGFLSEPLRVTCVQAEAA